MINTMTINGVSIATKNLILLKVPPIVKPNRRVRLITIPGRSGTLTEWSGDYDAYAKEPELLYTGSDHNDVLNFLRSASLVTFSNEPTYAYEVRADEQFATVIEKGGVFTIKARYTTQPLKRLATEITSSGATSYSLTNPGNEIAYPKLIITGTGNITVTVGAQVVTLAMGASEKTVTIDSLNGQVFDSFGVNAWSLLTGDLQTIPVSASAITVSTTGSALTVYPNWRWS